MVYWNWLNLTSRLVLGYLKGNTMGLIGLSESKQDWITHKPNLTFVSITNMLIGGTFLSNFALMSLITALFIVHVFLKLLVLIFGIYALIFSIAGFSFECSVFSLDTVVLHWISAFLCELYAQSFVLITFRNFTLLFLKFF